MNRITSVLALLLCLLPWATARAGFRGTFDTRDLVAMADVVVRAEPLEPAALKRFRVTELYRGKGLAPGNVVALGDLRDYEFLARVPGEPFFKRRPCRAVAALLFLRHDSRGWKPVDSGLRLLNGDGSVLTPAPMENPGPYELVVESGLRWDDLLRQVRADCASVQRLLAARAVPRTTQRNRLLLAWVQEHRHGFEIPCGWSYLDERIFTWVLEGRQLDGSWAAVRLYAELHGGRLVSLEAPVFGTPSGRDFLLSQAEAEGLQGDRVRALALVALPWTLRPPPGDHGVAPADGKEQASIVARLARLLKDRAPGVRSAVARALQAVVLPLDGRPGPAAGRALAALQEAYKVEASGLARDELAAAVHTLAGPIRWQQLTGNPHDLFIRLQDFERDNRKLIFSLQLKSDGVRVHECPTLQLERLEADKAVEKKETRVELANPPVSWEDGWPGPEQYLLSAQVSLQGLKPGTWRATVRGTAGKGKLKVSWVSEPQTFVQEAPRQAEAGVAIERR
jgi:hypothetical protein